MLRLLTWNIHTGIGGRDRRYEPERIADVIGHYDPDVVLLQEVDDGVPRSRQDHQAHMLADAMGYHHRAFGPNVKLKHGRYGNATLSRLRITHSNNINLTFPMKKRRGALYTELKARVGRHRYTLHVFNTHLGLSGMERRWQVRKLLDARAMRSLDAHSRVVIGGDTNDWASALPRGQLRQSGFDCITGGGARATRTFPAWAPVGALDRVFLRGALRCHHHFRSRLELARHASDHLPVVVDVEPLPR